MRSNDRFMECTKVAFEHQDRHPCLRKLALHKSEISARMTAEDVQSQAHGRLARMRTPMSSPPATVSGRGRHFADNRAVARVVGMSCLSDRCGCARCPRDFAEDAARPSNDETQKDTPITERAGGRGVLFSSVFLCH